MADRDALVERRERGGGDGRRVTLHEQKIRLLLEETLSQRLQRARREDAKILAVLHEAQVDMRRDAEDVERLLEHLAMLGRGDHQWFEMRMRSHRRNDRRHLDGFGSSADYEADAVAFAWAGHAIRAEMAREVGTRGRIRTTM